MSGVRARTRVRNAILGLLQGQTYVPSPKIHRQEAYDALIVSPPA
jgi:hypothetical protein